MTLQAKTIIDKVKYPLLAICFLAVVAVIAVNFINAAHPIAGKWSDAETGVFAEFLSDKKLIWIDPRWQDSMSGVQGTYRIDDDSTLTTTWEQSPTIFLSKIGTNAWTYKIDGDSMTLKNNRHTYNFTRID